MATNDVGGVRKKVEMFLEVKRGLLEICTETIDMCLELLTRNGYLADDDCDELLHLLLTVIDARPRCIQFYVNLVQKICVQNSSFVKTLKSFLLSTRERKVRRCLLIHRLYTLGLFTLTDIMDFIDRMINDKAFKFMKVHRKFTFGLFCWFSPEIASDSDKFERYFEKIKDSHNSPYFKTLENLCIPFLSQLDQLRLDNWARHKEMVALASSADPIAVAIRNDELFEAHDWNSIIEPTVFECCNFLNHYPSLLQYAAFHGSANSFRHILKNGGDREFLDKKKRRLEEYAIAGGNPEIIDIVFTKQTNDSSPLLSSPLAGDVTPVEQGDDEVVISGHRKVGSKRSLAREIGAERTYSGALQRRHAKKAPTSPIIVTSTESHLVDQGECYSNITVAKFHRFGVIKPKAGTDEFLRCCKSNCLELLMYCVENGINPNTSDEKTKTPGITIACQHGCVEIVRFLSICDGINLSIIDGTGVCLLFMEHHLFVLLLLDGYR